MKTKLEVLYAPWTVVVRYSDAVAAIEKLEAELEQSERLRANAVRRCGEWEKEVERLANLLTAACSPDAAARWDGPLKAL